MRNMKSYDMGGGSELPPFLNAADDGHKPVEMQSEKS